MARRGVTVSYESIRRWSLKFGLPYQWALMRRDGSTGELPAGDSNRRSRTAFPVIAWERELSVSLWPAYGQSRESSDTASKIVFDVGDDYPCLEVTEPHDLWSLVGERDNALTSNDSESASFMHLERIM